MELWFTEKQTSAIGLSCRVTRTLEERQTRFQHLAVLETEPWGRMLVLDGMIQLTTADEFVYHEMLAHVPLVAHGSARCILVVGGGDGGTVREALRHREIERVVLAEIDPEVVEVSRRFFPELAGGLDDPRVELAFGDGIEHVARHPGEYDVVLVDSTEPVGRAVGLFDQPFYEACRRALRPGGILVAQTESPFYNQDLVRRSHSAMSAAFGEPARTYLAPVPTYPSGLWSFTAASIGPDPSRPSARYLGREAPWEPSSLRYYSFGVHQAAFTLPPFVEQLLGSRASKTGAGAAR
ncbi:MAG: polyamine aminopropyltransferase [Limnochordaceae bacterium]|nr:polyamine aminopropyltransferase [Limnochordaceae bacterium]